MTLRTLGGQHTFLFLLTVVVALTVALYSTACGCLLTSDSWQYLSSAHSFSGHLTFLSPDGSYFTHWPPLFSVILSTFTNPWEAVRWLHVVAFVIVALALWRLAGMFFSSRFSQSVFLFLCLLNVQMIMVFSFVWSELIFMAFAYLNFYTVANLDKQRAFFWVALLTGILMCLQRNAGLFWVMGTCGWLVLFYQAPLRARIGKAVALFLVSTAGLWAWNIYTTFFLPADFRFYDHRFFDGFFGNLLLAGQSLAGILIPAQRYPLLSVIFLLASLAGIFFFRARFGSTLKLAACVLIAYTVCFVSLGPLDGFEIDRYFSVVVPLGLAFFLGLVDQALRIAPARWRPVVMGVVVLWSLYPVARTVNNVERWHDRSCSQESPASFSR